MPWGALAPRRASACRFLRAVALRVVGAKAVEGDQDHIRFGLLGRGIVAALGW